MSIAPRTEAATTGGEIKECCPREGVMFPRCVEARQLNLMCALHSQPNMKYITALESLATLIYPSFLASHFPFSPSLLLQP